VGRVTLSSRLGSEQRQLWGSGKYLETFVKIHTENLQICQQCGWQWSQQLGRLVQRSHKLEDQSRWPPRWSVLCVSLSFRSHLKSSPLKWFGREAPRSEALVHEERVVYRPCQRSSPSTSKDLLDMENDDGDVDLQEPPYDGETNSLDPHLYMKTVSFVGPASGPLRRVDRRFRPSLCIDAPAKSVRLP